MPHFNGPYLSTPDKPEVDPAVKAVVDIAKGILPTAAPGWGPAATPRRAAAAAGAVGEAGSPCNPQQSLHISLPRSVHDGAGSPSVCLSPAAHATGQLTYGVYEGGGTPAATSKLRPPRCGGSGSGGGGGGGGDSGAGNGSNSKRGVGGGSGSQGGDAQPRTAEVLAAQREVDKGCGGPSLRSGAVGDGGVAPLAEYAGSTLPVLNTPRALVETPKGSVDRMNSGYRTGSSLSAIPDEDAGQGQRQGKGHPREEDARRRREATARTDDELEVALWIEGVTGVTFPGKFWSSLKDGGAFVQTFFPILIHTLHRIGW